MKNRRMAGNDLGPCTEDDQMSIFKGPYYGMALVEEVPQTLTALQDLLSETVRFLSKVFPRQE